MESGSDDSDSFPSSLPSSHLKERCIDLAVRRDTSAYLQHITDVCAPPRRF